LIDETKISREIILSKLTPNVEKKVIEIKPVNRKTTKYDKSVQSLLFYMLKDPEVIKIYDKKITHISNDAYRHLAFQISAFYKQNTYINVADLLTVLRDDEESIRTIGEITSLNLKEDYTIDEIDDYLRNIKEYNDLKRIDKYKTELAMANDLSQKLELANKLIEFKLRSEEDA
jgi:RecG-like helicase